ncbi:hypothetical protein H4R18_004311 [Coemansia javaensis]|uniref:FAD/NAD(P)-binding domain-containing protein n=1 Tax=Coemansia javaensis TaxID=2761396 RepID=A0A9W8HB45_9FUNG|nr:hypothetical protein H4R18_004311 [Coemansia javaensis]
MTVRDIHVVVVGGSTAGLAVSRAVAALAKNGVPGLRVTLIDKNEYFYHMIGAPRGTVDAEYAHKQFLRLGGVLVEFEADPARPRHRFMQASLARVGEREIELSGGQTVAFDYLVLATGARNSFPANVAESSVEAARARMTRLGADIGRARSILVVGGGAVGVEMAGEIAAAHPAKTVTLVHSGSRLLPANFKEKLSAGAVEKLRRLGVKVVLNERIEIPAGTRFDATLRPLKLRGASGRSYQSDLQIMATGTKLHTEYLAPLEAQLGVRLRERSGAIRIRPTFQIDSPRLPNIFAVGDVAALPAGAKYAFIVAEQAKVAAANVTALVRAGPKGPAPPLKSWDGRTMSAIIVPIGPNHGVMQLFGMTLGASRLGNVGVRNLKGKDYFLEKTAATFPVNANA